jgi:hypothetical protein
MTKRSVAFLAIVGVIAVLAVLSRHSSAKAPREDAPRREIPAAVVNLTYVLENYQKHVAFTEKLAAVRLDYETRIKAVQAREDAIMYRRGSEILLRLCSCEREKWEKDLLQAHRECEALSKEGKAVLQKLTAEHYPSLYREIEEAAVPFAHGYAVVFVNAPAESFEVPRGVQCTLASSLVGCGQRDISYQVVQKLNMAYQDATRGEKPGECEPERP